MSITLDIGTAELEKYIDNARRRLHTPPAPEEIAQREALIAQARQVAAMLKKDFGAESVYLIGSLAHGMWLTDDSDIDLVAVGIDSYWRAWEAADKMIPERKVDLIDWDMATDSLRKTVEEEGVEL